MVFLLTSFTQIQSKPSPHLLVLHIRSLPSLTDRIPSKHYNYINIFEGLRDICVDESVFQDVMLQNGRKIWRQVAN